VLALAATELTALLLASPLQWVLLLLLVNPLLPPALLMLALTLALPVLLALLGWPWYCLCCSPGTPPGLPRSSKGLLTLVRHSPRWLRGP